VYPAILAAIFKVAGIYSMAAAVLAQILNAVISSMTCIPIYRLGLRLAGSLTGLFSCVLFAFYPTSVWYCALLWDTTLVSFLLALLIACLYSMPATALPPQFIKTGATMGLIILVNPAPAILYPFILAWVWNHTRNTSGVLIILALSSALPAPWMIRNFVKVGEFAPRSTLGLEMRLGNNEAVWRARTGSALKLEQDFSPSYSSVEATEFRSLGESAYDKRCATLAMQFIRADPGRFLIMSVRRFRSWWLGDEPSGAMLSIHTRLNMPLLKRASGLIPTLGLVCGLIMALGKGLRTGLILGSVATFPALYYWTVSCERFRFPIEPCMLVLGGYALARIFASATFRNSCPIHMIIS
jgi:hypothetical protein